MYDPDSDAAFIATNDQKSANYVKFYRQWVRNNFLSEREGREVGEEHDFILVISPGQSKTEVRRKATEADRANYADEWSAYKSGKDHQMSGTPIEKLPGLANGMADALKALYIYTIEQMAGLPDLSLQKIGMGGNEIRKRAKDYLAKGSAETEELRRQVAELQAEIARMREAQPKPRGRKPKPEGQPVALQ